MGFVRGYFFKNIICSSSIIFICVGLGYDILSLEFFDYNGGRIDVCDFCGSSVDKSVLEGFAEFVVFFYVVL